MDVRVGLKKAEHKRIDAFESWCLKDFLELCGSAGKESVCSVGDVGSIPGLGRSLGEGKGYSLQYSGLDNSMNYIVHGVMKNQTQLSNSHFTSRPLWLGVQGEHRERKGWRMNHGQLA